MVLTVFYVVISGGCGDHVPEHSRVECAQDPDSEPNLFTMTIEGTVIEVLGRRQCNGDVLSAHVLPSLTLQSKVSVKFSDGAKIPSIGL